METITPIGDQTSDYEAGLAVMLFLQMQPHGEADFPTFFRALGRYINLTKVDRQRSPSRPGDLKWHTAVRNIGREPYPPGNPIRDGYLLKREKGEGGYRLTAKPWKLPPRQIGLFEPAPPPPPAQSPPPPAQPQSNARYSGGLFLHQCAICGLDAGFGYDVALRKGRLGTWYCMQHWPDGAQR